MQRSYSPYIYFLSLSLLISLSACFQGAKKAQVSKNDPAGNIKSNANSKPESIKDMEFIYANMNSLDARTSVDINLGDFDQEVNGQIRWIRDSVFWMNFSLLGIEGARLLITKDSLHLIDRINKLYFTESLSKMALKYNIPFTFESVEAFLLGYPMILSNGAITEQRSGGQLHFTQEDPKWKSDYYTDTTMTQLNKMLIVQKGGDSNISNTLDNYKAQDGFPKFSFNRVLELYTRQIGKGHIKLEIEDLQINKPKEIKFSIPSSYERM